MQYTTPDTLTTALYTMGESYRAYADGTRQMPDAYMYDKEYLKPWLLADGKRVRVCLIPDPNDAGDNSPYDEFYVEFAGDKSTGYYVDASELSDFITADVKEG